MSNRQSNGLNEDQKNVVKHVENNHVTVVSASAGSGKTTTMIATVLKLIEYDINLDVDQFILITFTNKAASELRNKLEKKINKKAEEEEKENGSYRWRRQQEKIVDTYIGTIHSFCSELLSLFGYHINLPYRKRVITARRYLQEALSEVAIEGYHNDETSILLSSLPNYKIIGFLEKIYKTITDRGDDIDKIVNQTGEVKINKIFSILLSKLNDKYTSIKKEKGLLDNNDLLVCLLDLIEANEQQKKHIGDYLQKRYNCLFIDEFQDTDKVQAEIILHLKSYLDKILVVGDKKQAIYDFRGANYEMLEKIANDSGTDIKQINISFRPTDKLYNIQKVLFENLSKRYPILEDKTKLPEKNDAYIANDNLCSFKFISVFEDQQSIKRIEASINEVKKLLGQEIDIPKNNHIKEVELKDICFLFRSNDLMVEYAKVFAKEDNLPVKIDVGGQFFRKPEIVEMHYILQAILNFPDDISNYLALKTDYFDFFNDLDDNINKISDWLANNYNWYYVELERLKKESKYLRISEFLTEVYESCLIKDRIKTYDYQQRANLEKLVDWSREIMHSEALTLHTFVDRLKVAINTKENVEEASLENIEENKIVFSTVHSAKGLEYPIVIIPEIQKKIIADFKRPEFIANYKNGLIVSMNKIEKEKVVEDISELREGYCEGVFESLCTKWEKNTLEEEARLLYVAITRAQNSIRFISIGDWANKISTDCKYWSWKDEILKAKKDLEAIDESGSFVKFEGIGD